MPETTKGERARRRRGAIRGAIGFVLCQGGTALFLLWLRTWVPAGWVGGLLLAIAVLDLLLIPPVFVVLRQRLKEIKGGELDAAGQY